jgi:hypothetical protein
MVINWLYRLHVYQLSDLSEPFAEAIYGAICSKTPAPAQFICPLMKQENVIDSMTKDNNS